MQSAQRASYLEIRHSLRIPLLELINEVRSAVSFAGDCLNSNGQNTEEGHGGVVEIPLTSVIKEIATNAICLVRGLIPIIISKIKYWAERPGFISMSWLHLLIYPRPIIHEGHAWICSRLLQGGSRAMDEECSRCRDDTTQTTG